MWLKKSSKFLLGCVFVITTLAGCGSAGHTLPVKTTDGYLSETKIHLPNAEEKNFSRIVFIRKQMQNKNIPMIFLNDRAVGSLPVDRYSETLVCAGEQTVRVGTRTDIVKVGEGKKISLQAGKTEYIQIYEENGQDFGMRQLSEDEAKQIAQGLEQSHLINRHQPICNTPLNTLKQINLAADALFVFDTAQMLPAGQAKVQKLVQDIQASDIRIEQIRVLGYTDRLGSDEYNQALSLERARAVARYMKQQGLQTPVVINGMGERDPITRDCLGNKATPQLVACLQPDRRVSIELMGNAGK